jgi:hypothetical protein
VPALQVWSPEFKFQFCQKKKERKKERKKQNHKTNQKQKPPNKKKMLY